MRCSGFIMFATRGTQCLSDHGKSETVAEPWSQAVYATGRRISTSGTLHRPSHRRATPCRTGRAGVFSRAGRRLFETSESQTRGRRTDPRREQADSFSGACAMGSSKSSCDGGKDDGSGSLGTGRLNDVTTRKNRKCRASVSAAYRTLRDMLESSGVRRGCCRMTALSEPQGLCVKGSEMLWDKSFADRRECNRGRTFPASGLAYGSPIRLVRLHLSRAAVTFIYTFGTTSSHDVE
jgi:hypothetical protein